MGAKSDIEWTDSTWNPVRGCTRVSEGCRNCYAEVMAARFSKPGQWGNGFAEMKGGDHRWTGKVARIHGQLSLPLRWKTPRKIFVNSTSDLFHEALPIDDIAQVFSVMAVAKHHTFQVLTKRPERMRAILNDFAFKNLVNGYIMTMDESPIMLRGPLSNVWLGTSIEDQERADERVPHLLHTPAAVRFVSAEPLLGPIHLGYLGWPTRGNPRPRDGYNALIGARYEKGNLAERLPKLNWVIAGGESGPGARPMHPNWARSLRDQCAAAEVSFFMKQWGEWGPDVGPSKTADRIMDGRARCAWFDQEVWHYEKDGYAPDLEQTKGCGEWVYHLGKKANGALLDGREHKEFPEARP